MRIRRATLRDGRHFIHHTFDERPAAGGVVGADLLGRFGAGARPAAAAPRGRRFAAPAEPGGGEGQPS